MAAPKDNKNAQKWNRAKVSNYLREIKHAAIKKRKFFLGQELVRLGLYKDIWAYWKRRFGKYDSLMEQMIQIEEQFEANLYEAALNRQISTKLAILCLRNAHKWRCQAEIENPLTPAPAQSSDLPMYLSRAA